MLESKNGKIFINQTYRPDQTYFLLLKNHLQFQDVVKHQPRNFATPEPGLLHLTIVSQTILHHEFHIISFKHELRRKRDSSQIHARSSEYGNISTLLTRFFSRVLTTVPGRTRAENRRNTRRMRLCP